MYMALLSITILMLTPIARLFLKTGQRLIPLVESRYRTYTQQTDLEGLQASRNHRAIGGFSMGAVTTWYALEYTLDYFKYFLPISSDGWSLGRFAGMNYPDETALIWQYRSFIIIGK